MKKSTYLPLLLVAYLGVMAYIGRKEFYDGNYLYYFGIIGITLVCIFLLRIFLKRKERYRRERLNSDDK